MDVNNCILVHAQIYQLDPQSVKPHDTEPPQIEWGQEGPGLQIFPLEGVTTFKAPGADGVARFETSLTPEATQLLREAGHTDDTLVFDLGRRPSKYKNKDHLPPTQYNWDSAESLLDSIFDSFYRSDYLDGCASTCQSIKLVLHASKEAPPQKPKITTDLNAIPREQLDRIRFVIDV